MSLQMAIKAYIKEQQRKEEMTKTQVFQGLIRHGHLRKDSEGHRR